MKQKDKNAFANINHPVTKAAFGAELPVGSIPCSYSLVAPNGVKVTIMLEELLALPYPDTKYDAWLINILKSEQLSSGYVDLNSNSKPPVLIDHSTASPTGVTFTLPFRTLKMVF